jgi:hypothetical protein
MRYRYWWACGIMAVFAGIAPGLLWNGGTMDREASTFIRQYTTDDRPVVRKIFDPHRNDWGTYQARELSYFFDYLDAVVYRFVYRTFRAPVFLPLSSLVASLLLAVIFSSGVSRSAEDIDPLTASLLFGCIISSFVFVSTMAVFYRSAKPLLAAGVLALLFHVRQASRRRRMNAPDARLITRDAVWACALAVVCGLLDRQGFAYVVAGCALVGLHVIWTRRLKDVWLGLLTALGVLVAYNYAFAPVAIRILNSYWPNFSYQRIPLGSPSALLFNAARAGRMLVENAALLAGGSYTVAALLFGGAILLPARVRAIWWPARGAPANSALEADRRCAIYVLLGFGLQVLIFALMIARHPNVYTDLDHRYWYYPLPFVMTVLFAVVGLLDAVLPHASMAVSSVIRGGLILCIIGNLAFVPVQRQVMGQGSWFRPVFAQSAALKHSLQTGEPDTILDPAYRRFFDVHSKWLSHR